MRTLKRIGIIAGLGFFVLAATLVVMFVLGKPVTPQASPEAAAPVTVAGEVASPGASGEVPAQAEESDPLAIQIPGCVCHSDDPALVAEHATYRMSECFGCHQDGTPAMGQ